MGTERSVIIAQEEADELDDRVIHRVGRLHITDQTPSAEDSDQFNLPASEIKKFAGTDAVFKRKVTNTLKKVNQNYAKDASSKQIEEEYSGYDAFGVVSPPYNLDYLARLYTASAPHKGAVDAKVANIVGLGYKFVETGKTKRILEEQEGNEKKIKKTRRALDLHRDELFDIFEDFNMEDTFTETLSKVWMDYETTGNGYIEIARKSDGTIGYVGHIPAQTMRVRKERDGFVQLSANKAEFFANFGEKDSFNPVGGDSPNEVIHIKKNSPVSNYYGIPDIISAMQAITGNEFASRFNLDYFENKAIPRHLVIIKGAKLGNAAQAELLSFFETNLKGQNHRSLVIPLPSDTKESKVEFKIEPIEAGIQDSSFSTFRLANDKEILMVHRVPETKISVSGGVNIAVAKDADKTFKEQVCAPQQKILEKKLNRIVKELTDAFELKLNEMTLTDADTQSKIDERNVKAGIDLPNEVRGRDGKPGIKGGDQRVDLNAKDKIAQAQAELRTTRERDASRSANAGDNNATGRNAKGEGRAQS